MIIASAVRSPEGQVFIGIRHKDAYDQAMKLLKLNFKPRWEEGFVTSELSFLNRKEAYMLAKKNGQYNRKDGYDSTELQSTDLW